MNLVEIIKVAAMEAVKASKPTEVIEGTVTSVSPLKIKVSQMQTLDSAFLVLTDAVKDREVEVTVNWQYETGKKKMTIHNKLKVGERVVMIRTESGQKFYVVGRISE